MIARFPYGKAPFWILLIAVGSTLLWAVTRRGRSGRPDLVLVTFAKPHFESYERAVPQFEREHGVRVQVQYSNWGPLQTRLQNAMLAGTDVPDLAEVFEGSMGFF